MHGSLLYSVDLLSQDPGAVTSHECQQPISLPTHPPKLAELTVLMLYKYNQVI